MDDLLGSLRVNQSDGGYFAAHDRDVGFRPSGAKSFERNPLHLIEGDPVVTLVVEPGDPREFMAGHLLGDLELTAVLKVGGDPGCSEAVGADLGLQLCSSCPLLDHHVHVGLCQGNAIRQPASGSLHTVLS